MSSSFATAWQSGDLQAVALLPPATDRERRIAAVMRAAERPVPAAVLEALAELARRLPASAARVRNLELLARGGAAVVVTGQQVGLFGGPLYTVYKAASAIVDARALAAESGVPVVPLFWLQTEDHDFDEIDHCYVPREGEAALCLRIAGGGVHPRVPVAHRRLGDDVTTQLDALAGALAGLPHAGEVVDGLRAAYVPGRPLAEALAQLLGAIFAEDGLLFFDPRGAVAELLGPVHARAIADAGPISEALVRRAQAIAAAGFDVQVHVRAGSPLSFVHFPDAEGPRFRVEEVTGGRFAAVGGDGNLSRAELLALASHAPLRLSTSALLRPIAQDALLPTAAYVGGPAEIAYFAQLLPLYPHFGRVPPLVLPRARFRIVDATARRLLDALGLAADEVADASRTREALLAEVVARAAGARDPAGATRPDEVLDALRPDEVLDALLSPFARRLDELAPRLLAVDATLRANVLRTRATVERAVQRLAARHTRALALRDGAAAARLDRARSLLLPDGQPQERHAGWPWFAARCGPSALRRAILEAVVPYDGTLREIAP